MTDLNKYLLSNEEQFNLGFKTNYKCGSPELLAYEEGVSDGCESQLAAIQPYVDELEVENEQLKHDITHFEEIIRTP